MKHRVLITGATGKLGRVIAQYLAAHGWNLVLTSRNIAKCEKLKNELLDLGVTVNCLELDLLDEHSVESAPERLAAENVCVTHILSNARSIDSLKLDNFGNASSSDFLEEIAVNVVSPYRMIMNFASSANHSVKNVVTIGSQYGVVAPNRSLYDDMLTSSPIQYGVSKAALHHLTRELSIRLAPNIRVNSIAFGGFKGREDTEFYKRYSQLCPSQRMLLDQEACGPVEFLLNEKVSSAITGHVLIADGGWTVW